MRYARAGVDAGVLEQARWWSWRRQRLDRTSRGVEDALRSVVGVYSANPWGPLSLLARVPRLLRGAAVEGVIDTRRAIRLPAMRRSVYLLPLDTAPAAFHATRGSGAPFRSLVRKEGIPEDTYERLKREVLLAAGSPRTAEEIRATVSDPPESLTPVLTALCAEGLLLRIKAKTIRSNEWTYAATRAWLGADLAEIDPAEALVWLAGDYIAAFGPVTAEDFAWWTGVAAGAAGEALRGHDPVDLGGGLLLHQRHERMFEQTRPHLGRINLLPKWDAYTMGYAEPSRARFTPPELLPFIYDRGGNALSVVLVEGRVAGVWDVRFPSRETAVVRLGLVERPGARERAAIEEEASLVGSFLEARETRIELSMLERPKPRRPTRRAGGPPGPSRPRSPAPARPRTPPG